MAAAPPSLDSVINIVLSALSGYPIIEGAVALLVLIFGLRAMSAGRKDGPALPSAVHDYPPWLMSAPMVNTMDRIQLMVNHNDHQVRLLEEIRKEARNQTMLLEQIANENVINPRRLQE